MYGAVILLERLDQLSLLQEAGQVAQGDAGLVQLAAEHALVDDLLEFLDMYEDKSSEFESLTLPMIYAEKFGFEEAVIKVLELIRSYARKSKDALDYFEDCESKSKLLRLVDYMTSDLIKNYVSKNREVLSLLESFKA